MDKDLYNVSDYEERSKRMLSKQASDYFNGAANDKVSLGNQSKAYE
jgi:(S)-2-hydroxy-acid oxidase